MTGLTVQKKEDRNRGCVVNSMYMYVLDFGLNIFISTICT